MFFVFVPLALSSQQSVAIFNEYTTSDTIDLGMCMPGDELHTIFNIKNLGDERQRMIGINPSYGVFQLPGHDGEFNEFFNVSNFPLNIEGNSAKQFLFKFQAFSVTSFPARKNTARLRIGVFNPDTISLPEKDDDLTYFRDFIVIGRKTEHKIDVFESFISFDSVYVRPSDTVRRQLIVQNSSDLDLVVHDVKFKRSFNAEITATIKTLPIDFNKYQAQGFQHTWDFAYYPRNMGLDTAVLSVYYKPDPVNFPDSVDVRETIIHAIGVQQDLGVIRADSAVDFTFNSINFGDVDVGQTKEIKFVVRTIGNISFKPLSQRILQIDSDKPGDDFELLRPMIDSVDLQPFNSDTMIVKFTPTRSDTFRVRLVVESDISRRDVIGYPDSVRYRTIYLNGVGREAEIANIPEEIDFGNIVVNETGDCPTKRDTLIAVSNIGNLELLVNSKVYPDNNMNPFKVEPVFISVPGRQSRFIKVIFDSIISQPGNYLAELYIISNSPKDKDTLITTLKARGVYPDTMDIRIPQEIISKPGRRISIPILIDKKKASIAKIFTDTITYNKSLLFFYGARTEGTASELAANVTAVQSEDNGTLFLNIETLGSERFLPSDTLIILEFDTYLGDNTNTLLHFVNPNFGDGICARILSLNKFDGSFRIDSVCGLDMKTGAQYQPGVRLKSIYPNPAGRELTVAYELDFDLVTSFIIYNTFGERVYVSAREEISKGRHSRKLHLDKLPDGLYFIEIRAGYYRTVKQLIISP